MTRAERRKARTRIIARVKRDIRAPGVFKRNLIEAQVARLRGHQSSPSVSLRSPARGLGMAELISD